MPSNPLPLSELDAQVAQMAGLLQARGWTMATAESCTGGMIAAACTDRAGSSAWFERGFVTYSNGAKSELLGVPEALLAEHGAVSEATARAMVEGAALRARTQVAVAVTGVAGPSGGSVEKPVGTVWFGVSVDGTVHTERQQFPGDRAAVRQATVRHAIGLLTDSLAHPTSASDASVPHWFEGFEEADFDVQGTRIHARLRRNPGKPALLLVHGFPQSHVMWHRVARLLAPHFSLVLPDLRGYGGSACPPGLPDHSNYSKRTMAADLVGLMDALGWHEFHLCGHDRGGRVAHRLALDHPERVRSLCVIDIAPTLDMYAATNMDFARGYYHWFHLIQPSPLPERMIGADARAYLHAKLGGWGSAGLAHYEPRALSEYERCFTRPANIHGACEDYRAAAGIDLTHDRESRAQGRRIACKTLVLWGQRGLVARMFDPIGLWQAQCEAQVSGQALPSGHFIPEELPEQTAQALLGFLAH